MELKTCERYRIRKDYNILNNLDGFNYPNFPRKNYPIIDRNQLPKRPFDPIILNDSKNGGGYIAGSNKEVEEFKKMLAQSNAGNAIADAAKEAYKAASDFVDDAGDFVEDTWDDVEDFFSGIF